MKTALVILRTPFQAWMAKQILDLEGVTSFSLVYFTVQNSSEDQNYYSELSSLAKEAQYIYVPKTRKDIFSQFSFKSHAKKWLRDKGCDLTLLSSIDAFLPSAIMAKQGGAELVTFDDGTSNINDESVFFIDRLNCRGRLYKKYFGALSLEETKKRIARHYTLHSEFPNIVGPDRLISLPGWSKRQYIAEQKPEKKYFLGAPFFRRELSKEMIHELELYLASLDIDAYVRHPREESPLNIGAPVLNKNGLIAEEAILRDAMDVPIHVLGTSSSVLFNMALAAQNRTMLLFSSSLSGMERLALKSGCDVINFSR